VTTIPYELTLPQRRRIIKFEKPDILLIQKQRHPDNRPNLYPGTRTVFDLDDAEYVHADKADDVIVCCRDSNAVIAGSRNVAEWCRQYNPNTFVVWTGTPNSLSTSKPTPPSQRRPIVTWATSSAREFVGEAELVRQVILKVAERTPLEFWLYGVPDDSPGSPIHTYLEPIRQARIPHRTFRYMNYGDFVTSLSEVAVGLQPIDASSNLSLGKSFGKVLAYLVADVAVVASDNVDHSEFFRDGENGFLVRDLDGWVNAVETLLTNPSMREQITRTAHTDYEQSLSIEAAARKVDTILRDLLRTHASLD
jgi:hypothetical protein